MKFDLDTAWKDTTSLIRETFSLLAVIAGVFYFVPYTAAQLWIPGMSELINGDFDPNSDRMQAMVNDMFANYWWALLLLIIVQGIGMLAMLTMLRRHERPTVAEAIGNGARSVASYIAAALIIGFGLGILIVLLVAIPLATGIAALGVLGAIAAFVFFCYALTKLSLSTPVIAIEGQLNPLAALRRSWQLTKGNSLRLFFFYLLIVVAYFVISVLIGLLFMLVFAFGGPESQEFGQAISTSLINAIAAIISACLLAAVYRQFTRLRDHAQAASVPPTD